jgi:hypothetical protein
MWTTSTYCQVSSVNFSDIYKEEDHSFYGTFGQMLAVTTFYIYNSVNFEFIPTEIFTEFLHLNGIIIGSCGSLTNLKSTLFTKDFERLQYVFIGSSQVKTIEVTAFQNLVNMKWISLSSNQIESLPFQIFRKNPELIYIDLTYNQINSIDSSFFQNLKKLKYVGFANNKLCVNKDFGCYSSTSSCSVSQADLDVGLATCYSHCLNNMECALKSGKFDILNLRYVEENIDNIVAYGHVDVLLKMNYTDLLIERGHLNVMVENGLLDSLVCQNYFDQLIQNGHLDLLIQKNYTDLLIKNGYKNNIVENDWNLRFAYTDINKNTDGVTSALKKDDFAKTEATVLLVASENFNEIERVEKKFEKIWAKFGSDLKVQQDKVGVLEDTVANLDEEGYFSDRSNHTRTEVEGRSLKFVEKPGRYQTWGYALSDTTKGEIVDLNRMLMLQVSEAKLLMQNERLTSKLNKGKPVNGNKSGVGSGSGNAAMEADMKSFKDELAAFKDEMETLKEYLGAR